MHKSSKGLLIRLYIVIFVVSLYCLILTMITHYEVTSRNRQKINKYTKDLEHFSKVNIIKCFIITLNKSLESVVLKDNITCFPFFGQTINEEIFSYVDITVQKDLIRAVSTRGAHYTNNKSVSIAWNHMLLWNYTLNEKESQDLLIFEDDAIITNHSIDVYRKIKKSGKLGNNYILKLVNGFRMKWLGISELKKIDQFEIDNNLYVLEKCHCKTKQNFFNIGSYVIDQDAARVLLKQFMPMRFHVDIYMHYVGCKSSNFFMLDHDALQFSGRPSTHQSPDEKFRRILPAFKEQLMNIFSSDC